MSIVSHWHVLIRYKCKFMYSVSCEYIYSSYRYNCVYSVSYRSCFDPWFIHVLSFWFLFSCGRNFVYRISIVSSRFICRYIHANKPWVYFVSRWYILDNSERNIIFYVCFVFLWNIF